MKTLRIWFGCSFGLAVSMVMGWELGFLAILLPLFVLSISDSLNFPLLLIIFVSAVWSIIQANVLWGMFGSYPPILLTAVAVVFLFKCIAMTKKQTFIVGYMGLIVVSILVHLSSYDFIDVEEISISIGVYCLLNIVICSIAYWLFPDPTIDEQHQQQEGGKELPIHYDATQIMVIWAVVMLSYIFFQVVDLLDSSAAYASILVILAPLTCAGAVDMAKVRVIGTAAGCAAGLAVQLTLGQWYENAFLYWLLLTIAMGPSCYWHTQGKLKSALASSAMASLTVPLTTVLIPGEQDAFFSILYRFSSIFIAVVISALFILLMQKILEYKVANRAV
ncbi:DUF2955 domain-containing protein [Vibrio sp. Isolate31]|uniref:DUF2955 domain-containing protein n=1 Tax=unclassified Vibrio TaxID=2614977 RepID=UPI001EFD8C48|nr:MULTISPECIES: DUF2955 domain-containing protein [unclassified Vibrio]MCG9555699.1 DUF2955 domain-containing protein [Vibrio sp. Isolate32]MCG9601355.1 DUF2955 domain-containing protein [Vibrio sp. Isolate31]